MSVSSYPLASLTYASIIVLYHFNSCGLAKMLQVSLMQSVLLCHVAVSTHMTASAIHT